MLKLLWAERQKLRRSSIALLTIFATVLAAIVVFIGGNSMDLEGQYIDSAGWYMTMVQPWATLLVIPAVIALLGSYMVCREEQDDTMKTLRLIPANEVKLTIAKLIVTFIFSIFVYVLLFVITFLTEACLHFSDLTAGMVLGFLKTYFLEGIGVFLAVSPIIALVTYTKKSYWLALILTEMYSFAGMFMSMSGTLRAFYPITAVMGVAGYYETTTEKLIANSIVNNDSRNNKVIPYTMEYLSTASIVSGLPYQRLVEDKDVDKLIREWDGRLLEPLVVSFRNERYYLVDGQHRIVVLRRMNGGKDLMVPCKVYRGLTYEMEAELCFKLDKSRKKLTLAQSTIALVESGTDSEVMDIVRLIEKNGFLWTLDKEFPGDYEIRACRAVISAYRLLGRDAFNRMLSLMYRAWDGEPSSLKGHFISGMALFMKTYGIELEYRAAVKRFSVIDPEDVIDCGRQDRTVRRSALRYARALLERYNAQCEQKLPYRFKE